MIACLVYKAGTSSGIFRNTVRVRILPIPCDLNSAIQIALSPDRTELTDKHRATAPMEHEDQQMRKIQKNPAVQGSYSSNTECMSSSSQKDEKMKRADWKGLVLLAGYAWFRV